MKSKELKNTPFSNVEIFTKGVTLDLGGTQETKAAVKHVSMNNLCHCHM